MLQASPGVIGKHFGPGEVPGAPTLSLVVAGSTVTATIDGDDGVTNYLVYWKSGDGSWSAGGNRAGDGDIEVNGLTEDVTYVFAAYSVLAGIPSLFSKPATTSIVSAGGDITATGQLGLAATNLKDLLAESATFQSAVGAGDADAAKGSIYLAEYYPDDETFTRPFALITRAEDQSESLGSSGFGFGGELELWLESEIAEEYQDNDQAENAEQGFFNYVDGCLADCQALSNQAGYLLTRSWTVGDLYRIDKKHIYGIKIVVVWGLAE